ncbi:hypothetical protein TIFTF001_039406 [Ficus carica]|uniref:Uncharacterized protein n=1 Tax=Ficus carica TaxID=3494 RepID=A0AA88E949_FICCA|nr:hypothetical protein TIFTF001_039406 [Ficus carica]
MRIEVLARASHPYDLLALFGVPRGSSSASRREECQQLGYWPLTTRSPEAQAPCIKFVILTVSSAPSGAWTLLLSYHPLPCSPAPYSSSRLLIKLASRVAHTLVGAAEPEWAQNSAYVFGHTHNVTTRLT